MVYKELSDRVRFLRKERQGFVNPVKPSEDTTVYTAMGTRDPSTGLGDWVSLTFLLSYTAGYV